MNTKKQKLLEADLKPCKCGGRLIIKETANGRRFTHLRVKCEKCGAWYGGITSPEKKEGLNT